MYIDEPSRTFGSFHSSCVKLIHLLTIGDCGTRSAETICAINSNYIDVCKYKADVCNLRFEGFLNCVLSLVNDKFFQILMQNMY
jgi:hypothetical protein